MCLGLLIYRRHRDDDRAVGLLEASDVEYADLSMGKEFIENLVVLICEVS